MKALQIASAVLLALTVTFAVTLGVVCLMYYVNLESSPQMREEWPSLLAVTAIFWVLSAFAAMSWWAQRRQAAWMWPAQILSVLGVVVGAMLLVKVLGS
ncbi:hypothetical protein AAG565_02720 [Fontimonas sp. SYSU GA230001]|uniref:hypothetical protein n=1 Tax=Fontimonas sp. SYSU GA230001 TaxID=3142450 RepID=UPI0032B5376A